MAASKALLCRASSRGRRSGARAEPGTRALDAPPITWASPVHHEVNDPRGVAPAALVAGARDPEVEAVRPGVELGLQHVDPGQVEAAAPAG